MLNVRRSRRLHGAAPRKAGSRGAGLIEVLVAILIASMGLLAFAATSAASVRYTKMAQYRATATQLAGDISERARANIIDGNVGVYEYGPGVAPKDFADQLANPPVAPGTTCRAAADTCTVAQIAAMDLYEWRLAARNLLPDGSVFLQKDAAVAGAFDVWIAWRDPGLAATDEASTVGAIECNNDLDAPAGVRCMYFRVKL
jgi:type IV pilus assembly protein PilV